MNSNFYQLPEGAAPLEKSAVNNTLGLILQIQILDNVAIV